MIAATLHPFLCNIEARNLHGCRATHLAPPYVQHRTTNVRNGQQNPSCTPCKTVVFPCRSLIANHLDQSSHRRNYRPRARRQERVAVPAITGQKMAANHLVDDAWCPGCGLVHEATGEHRPDCTAEPSPLICDDCDAIRLPSERGAAWRYDPTTRTYHCSTHQKGTK